MPCSPLQGGSPSFPDSANTCQVSPAGSIMGTDTDLDSSPGGQQVLFPFPVRKPRPRATYPNSKVKGSSLVPFSLGLLTPSPAVIELGRQVQWGWECGSVTGLRAACLPRSKGHTPPLHLASSHTEHPPFNLAVWGPFSSPCTYCSVYLECNLATASPLGRLPACPSWPNSCHLLRTHL